MPKPTRTRVTGVPVLNVTARHEKAEVVAHPVQGVMPSGQGGDLTALLTGLQSFNSNLSSYLDNEADREVARGARERADGSPLSDNAGEWRVHGYMKMDGQVKGQTDGAALQTAYETAFDKDAGDLEGFITDHFARSTKGLQDKSFLSGYAKSYADSAQQLRAYHAKYQQE